MLPSKKQWHNSSKEHAVCPFFVPSQSLNNEYRLIYIIVKRNVLTAELEGVKLTGLVIVNEQSPAVRKTIIASNWQAKIH